MLDGERRLVSIFTDCLRGFAKMEIAEFYIWLFDEPWKEARKVYSARELLCDSEVDSKGVLYPKPHILLEILDYISPSHLEVRV